VDLGAIEGDRLEGDKNLFMSCHFPSRELVEVFSLEEFADVGTVKKQGYSRRGEGMYCG